MARGHSEWSPDEIRILIQGWPRGGVEAVRHLLPGRTDSAIRYRAVLFNLKVEKVDDHEFEPDVKKSNRTVYRSNRPQNIEIMKSQGLRQRVDRGISSSFRMFDGV